MKRLVLTLTIALSFIAFSSFKSGDDISAAAIQSFNASFKNVTQVNWSINDNYYKADFILNGRSVAAYFDEEGHTIAIARNISSPELPVSLQASLKKNYDCYWISNLFELANDEGTSYYITLENGDTKLVLKSISSADWSTYKKQKKS